MKTKMDFIQKRTNTCGVAVCRYILYDAGLGYFSEDGILKKVDSFFQQNTNGWKNDFLTDNGSMPTDKLRELLEKLGAKSQIEYDLTVSDIKDKIKNYKYRVIAIIEKSVGQFHAVLITDISDKMVSYFEPGTGEIIEKDIYSFNVDRTPKSIIHKFLEILYIV